MTSGDGPLYLNPVIATCEEGFHAHHELSPFYALNEAVHWLNRLFRVIDSPDLPRPEYVRRIAAISLKLLRYDLDSLPPCSEKISCWAPIQLREDIAEAERFLTLSSLSSFDELRAPPLLPLSVPFSLSELQQKQLRDTLKAGGLASLAPGAGIGAAGATVGIMMIPFDAGLTIALLAAGAVGTSVGVLGSPLAWYGARKFIDPEVNLDYYLAKKYPTELEVFVWHPNRSESVPIDYSKRKYIVRQLFEEDNTTISTAQICAIAGRTLFPFLLDGYIHGVSLESFLQDAQKLKPLE